MWGEAECSSKENSRSSLPVILSKYNSVTRKRSAGAGGVLASLVTNGACGCVWTHMCVCVCVCVCVWEWCDTHGIALVGVAALQKMQFVANPPVIYILPFTWVVQRRRCSFNDTTRNPAPGGHDPPALATYSTTPSPPPRSPPLCLPVRRPAPAVYTLSLSASLRLSPPSTTQPLETRLEVLVQGKRVAGRGGRD